MTLQQARVPCLPKDTKTIWYHRRSSDEPFKFGRSNLCQFFKIHCKRVALELLAPICMGEKSGIHSRGFFPLEVSGPALHGDEDKVSTEALLLWPDLVCPLLIQVPYSFLCPTYPLWICHSPISHSVAASVIRLTVGYLRTYFQVTLILFNSGLKAQD